MSRRRKKPIISTQVIVAVFLAISLLFFGIGKIFIRSITSSVTQENHEYQEFVVSRGDTTLKIASNLYHAGLIRSPLGFRYIVKTHSLGDKLQSGTYYLRASSSTLEIANKLTTGVSDLSVTIPEGYRLEQIAIVLEAELGLSATEFLTSSQGLEGYLFPDTYHFAPSSSVEIVITTMQNNFESKIGQIDKRSLILASLIERETRGSAEKPVVAGILEKRLSAGWPLELDATVQYALGRPGQWWSNTTLADRQTSSPYNTYQISGLPPHPICNPGIESINAAQAPQASEYWFYLHGRDGQIHYATTNAQHSANIDQYIR
jgi:UPF0755 protein